MLVAVLNIAAARGQCYSEIEKRNEIYGVRVLRPRASRPLPLSTSMSVETIGMPGGDFLRQIEILGQVLCDFIANPTRQRGAV